MSKKELDSITEKDLAFLEQAITRYELSVDSVPELIDICNALSEKFKISCSAEVCEVRGYYYVDAEFGNMEVSGVCSIDIKGSEMFKYLKKHGSGKCDSVLDEFIEDVDEHKHCGIYRDIEFDGEDMEQLPSFLYFGKEDEEGRIEVKSIRDDIDCYYERVSKSYYYQP